MSSQTDKTNIQAYLKSQSDLDTLRFITCGSVDDGKSTLIGRMLFDGKCLFDDQVSALQKESKKHGTQGQDIDFALLVDGLSAEREQGITIDVAYRFFTTDQRKFIVADTPGHSEYTRNMATGASTASLAVILVDARRGMMEQTRRHTLICQLMGIRQIILAVNKMDLVHYEQTIFESICADYNAFTADMGFDDITPIALSALKGENVTSRSGKMRWYHGPTLISKLETADTAPLQSANGFALPVQLVNRPTPDFRGFNGIVMRAPVKAGDKVRASPSGATSNVKHIWLAGAELKEAAPGLSVTLELEDEIGISRGDFISAASHPIETSDQFEADIVWMSHQAGHSGRTYSLKLAGQNVTTTLASLKYQVDVNTGQKLASTSLNLNEIARVTLNTQRPICFDDYGTTPQLGAFILIDNQTNETVAAGMIRFALRRATNIHRQQTDIDKKARRALSGHTSKVFWFTGLSGSGKSTIANKFANELHARGIRTYILDGDNIRHGLNKDLGFTDADRVENIRRIAEVAKLMVDAGVVVLTAFISPFRAERDMARSLFEEDEFVEVFVDTPIEICEQRDVKGLYKKARAGEIPNFTGIGSTYEAPRHPEVTLKTEGNNFSDILTVLMTRL
jgi:bifunctional enzyme CysN/CysC